MLFQRELSATTTMRVAIPHLHRRRRTSLVVVNVVETASKLPPLTTRLCLRETKEAVAATTSKKIVSGRCEAATADDKKLRMVLEVRRQQQRNTDGNTTVTKTAKIKIPFNARSSATRIIETNERGATASKWVAEGKKQSSTDGTASLTVQNINHAKTSLTTSEIRSDAFILPSNSKSAQDPDRISWWHRIASHLAARKTMKTTKINKRKCRQMMRLNHRSILLENFSHRNKGRMPTLK